MGLHTGELSSHSSRDEAGSDKARGDVVRPDETVQPLLGYASNVSPGYS